MAGRILLVAGKNKSESPAAALSRWENVAQACRKSRIGSDGSNGPYFNNDKSPWFDATTDMAGLEISPRDITVRGLSRAFYLLRSCLLLCPTGRFKTYPLGISPVMESFSKVLS